MIDYWISLYSPAKASASAVAQYRSRVASHVEDVARGLSTYNEVR